MSFLRDPNRLIATIIVGVVGLIVLLDFAHAIPQVDGIALILTNWAALLAALALIAGLLSVIASHLVRVVRRSPDWGYSLVLLVAMFLVIINGTIVGLVPNPNGGFNYVIPQSLGEQPVRDLFNSIYQPLASSFLALLAFFSLSAALRAIRRRTAEALVIVGIAVIVLLVTALPQAESFPLIGASMQWVNDFVVLAGARGLLLGAALGGLVAGIRVLVGFDQPYLDR